MTITVLIAGVLVNAWLLTVVYRQNVRRRLPWFVIYVAWEVLLTCIQLGAWAVGPRFYVALYWWMEAAAVVLIVGAVRESFLRIFKGFTALAWFRWTVSGVIAAVILYSAWKAIYHPPVQSTRLAAFVVGAEFMFRWGICGIAFLTTILSVLLKEPMDTREDAVVTGFGIASITILASAVSFSLFGTRYLFFNKYAPSVGYFVAAFLWIRVFSRPVEGFGFEDLGIGPEDLLKLMRRYREDIKRVREKQ